MKAFIERNNYENKEKDRKRSFIKGAYFFFFQIIIKFIFSSTSPIYRLS